MAISKKDFDALLKADALANGFTVQGNYLVFDNTANLNYRVIAGYTLAELLTKNPVASYTKLNKDLLIRVAMICEILEDNPTINSSYRSPEYNLTVPGSAKNSWHTKGDAIDLGYSNPQALFEAVDSLDASGELGTYDWGCHVAVCSGQKYWDNRTDKTIMRKVKNFIAPDATRNYVYYALLAVIGFIFIKKLF